MSAVAATELLGTGPGPREAAGAHVNRPPSHARPLESRREALSGKTEIVDHPQRGNRHDASAGVRLRRHLLQQLILEPAGQFVINQPDERDQSERRSVQSHHRARAERVQERLAGDGGRASAGEFQNDAQVAAAFQQLAAKWTSALAKLETLQPPPHFTAAYNRLKSRVSKVTADLDD